MKRLWFNVSEAIRISDQIKATEEKSIIETKQREEDLFRKTNKIQFEPKYFINIGNSWFYKYTKYMFY